MPAPNIPPIRHYDADDREGRGEGWPPAPNIPPIRQSRIDGSLVASRVMRLYILDYGLFKVHENGRVIGIPGYLIVPGNGRVILVDTGFPPWYAEDPVAAAHADGLDTFGHIVQLSQENLPAAQLALVGVTTADITDLVITHTHIDHVGGLGCFPNATIVIGKAERALPAPLYWGDVRPIAWPEARYLTIEKDTRLLPGVTILPTPGHSPGHLSVLLRLPRTGNVLLTADAVSRPAELEEDHFDGAWDPSAARASAHRLMDLAARRDASIIFGHDPQQWKKLRKAPDCYE